MAWTYILQCDDGSYYVGSTVDIERRLGQHQAGEGAAYTRHRLPVTLLWTAQFASIRDAYLFEKQVQGWGRAKREALMGGRLDLLPTLASRCWSARQEVAGGRLPAPPARPSGRTEMPWDVPHEQVHDPDDPWAPLRPLESIEKQEPRFTRIVPEGWSRDGC